MSPISPKAASLVAHRQALRGRGDRQRDPEVGARLVDPHPACDVDEHIGAAERQPGVPREHGDDHREALRVDARPHPARHREVGGRDEGLDLEQQRPRALERAGDGRADLAAVRAGRTPPTDRGRRRARRRSSRRRRARWSSRTGSSPLAGCDGRGSGRPRTAARSRRGARGRVARQPSRPSSRARRGTSRRRSPSRRAAGGPPPRAPATPSPGAEPISCDQSVCTESITQTAGRSRSSVAQTASSSVSARISTPSQPPSRAARSFTCATDSSPVTSSARRSREIAPSAFRSSVDLPTPGSPPTSTSDAGTSPPPSTRSSSGTPVEIRSDSSATTSTSRSGARAVRGALRAARGAAPRRPSSRTRRSRGSGRASGPMRSRTPCRRAGSLRAWPWADHRTPRPRRHSCRVRA